ncbi:MAG: O-antigen ligase family protein [Verrucomicrobiales bacterium]
MPRSLMIFAALIPLAILLGVMLATPLDATTMLIVGVVFLILMTPVLLKHHHTVLIFSWGAYVNAFFLPGQPPLWLLMAFVSLFFAILTRTLNRDVVKFLYVPSLTWALIFLGMVVLTTAQLTGGIGLRALGSEVYGGKRYFFLIGGIFLYFAIVCKAIEKEKRQKYAAAFFLTGITAVVSNITYTLGPSFYFLFLLFPTDWAFQQAFGDMAGPMASMTRISGLSPAASAVVAYMLLRYTLQGVLDLRHPLRLLVFFGAIGAGMFSGFRTHIIFTLLLMGMLFMLQKVYRTRLLPITLVVSGLSLALLAVVAERLPLPVQRSLAVLPIKVDPIAAQDTKVSSEWRLDMWRVVVQELPKYLLIGKGYALDPTDIFLTEEAVRRGQVANWESAILAGDYHNGPLSVIVTFGIPGSIAFLWVLIAGGRVLWKNYRYGEAEIWNINTFLLALFLARTLFFFAIYGSFQTEFFIFTGIFGLSISLNNGVRTPEDLQRDMEEAAVAGEEPEIVVPAPQRDRNLIWA